MTTHGWAGGYGSISTYNIWKGVRKRAKGTQAKKYYADKGIDICERWNRFENFLEDMGPCPPGLSLERRDNSKGYSKDNCKWATSEEQNNNRSSCVYLEFNGERLTVTQWAKKIGIRSDTLFRRLSAGWSIERALTEKRHKTGTQRLPIKL